MAAADEKDHDPNSEARSAMSGKSVADDHRKPISEEELKYVFEQHQIWLFSDSQEGAKASFEGITLALPDDTTRKLHKLDLREADLHNIDFAGVDLTGADLRGCNLTGADFGKANLKDTKLQGAILENAKMDLVENLLPDQLAATVLSGAKLPVSVDDFKNVEQASKLAKLGRSIFFLMLATAIFAFFVIATTPDIELIAGQTAKTLPLINFDLPIVAFIMVAPLFVLALYFYLNLYLIAFFEELSSLPAVFPDGRKLDQHVEPWIMTSLIYAHMRHLKKRKPSLSSLRERAAIFIAWYVAPIFFLFVWAYYIKAHQISSSMWHASLLVVSLLLGMVAYRIGTRKLKGEVLPISIMPNKTKSFNMLHIGAWAVLLLTLMSSFSYILMRTPPLIETQIGRVLLTSTGLSSVNDIDQRRFLVVSDSEISMKPDNWRDPIEDEEREDGADNGANRLQSLKVFNRTTRCDYPPSDRFSEFGRKSISREIEPEPIHPMEFGIKLRQALKAASVEVATLANRNLRYIEANGVFLAGASLNGTDLEGARLVGADLRAAALDGVQANGAVLADAKLYGASLNAARLRGAILANADMEKVTLIDAKLGPLSPEMNFEPRSAELSCANLRDSSLYNTELQKAYLVGANLTSIIGRNADFSEANLANVLLEDADLMNANFSNAYLTKANLREASLVLANLSGADLTGADLSGADLSTAKGLAQGQLDGACGDVNTLVPEGLEIKNCPAQHAKSLD